MKLYEKKGEDYTFIGVHTRKSEPRPNVGTFFRKATRLRTQVLTVTWIGPFSLVTIRKG